MSAARCDARRGTVAEPWFKCQRPAGHGGPHSDTGGIGAGAPAQYWGPAAILTCPEGFPDYVECGCGNDPISGLGFMTATEDGEPYPYQLIRCGECGAIYDGAAIDAAEGQPGATFEPVNDDV